MKINLKNVQTGEVKQATLGFSWTLFFFGFLVPLVRGDLKWTAIMVILVVATVGLAWLVLPFTYNKTFVRDLIGRGYIPCDDFSTTNLRLRGITFQKGAV